MSTNNVPPVLALGDVLVSAALLIIGDDGFCNTLAELETSINGFLETGPMLVLKLTSHPVEPVGRPPAL